MLDAKLQIFRCKAVYNNNKSFFISLYILQLCNFRHNCYDYQHMKVAKPVQLLRLSASNVGYQHIIPFFATSHGLSG